MSHVLAPTMRAKGQAAVRAPGIFGASLTAFVIAAALGMALILAPRAAQAASAPGDPYTNTAARSGSALSRPAQGVKWTNFKPVDWVLTHPFTTTVTVQATAGLEPLADMYSVSTDGGTTWSAWSTDALSIDIPVSTTHQLTVTNLTLPDSASLNYIRFRAVETGGADAISPANLVRVDATPPAAPLNLTAIPSDWSNTGSFTVNWTNPPDIMGIAGAWYKLDAPPSSPTDGTFVVTSNSITGITPAQDGVHPIYVWLQDSFGRAEPKNAANTTLYWDTVPPGPPSFMSGSPARQWTNVNKFSESWRNPTDPSGIAGAYYKLNGLPLSPTDGTFVTTVNSISDIRVPYEGRHDIYVWLVDGAGNLDPQALTGDPGVFRYDATLPVSSMTVTPTLPATGWYTSSVAVSFAATDLPLDPAYPPAVYYQVGNEPWTAANGVRTFVLDGPHQLQYQARDKAGNVEATRLFGFGIDQTAPTVTLEADRKPNATGWYTAAVTYTLSVVDTVSGSPRGFYRLNDGPWQSGTTSAPTVFRLAAEGSYRIQYYGRDAAGNLSPQVVAEAHVDATPPATTQTVEATPGENGWYVSNATVRLTPQDNGSGAVTTHYRVNGGAWQTGIQFPLTGDGVYEIAYYSTDAAGNAEPVQTSQVKIDGSAPAAAAGLTAAPTGWSRTNAFTVQWTSPSDLSGVTGAYYKLGDLSGGGAPAGPKDGTPVTQTAKIEGLALPAEGSYRLYLWLRDAAGNADDKKAPANGPVLRYDATAPVTSVQTQGQPGLNGWWLSPVVLTLTASDGASGVATLHHRIDGGPWQATNKTTATVSLTTPDKHVIEYYAEDVAGNFESMQQYTARLDFTAPPAPALVRVLPSGWTRYNDFHIEWTAVTDLSNVGGAYVKFDGAPANATDGTFYGGSTQINGVKAPSEGRHSVYVWLRDTAGNADSTTAVAVSDAVWYDGTPPTSVITPTAASGLNGWYVEPVTFDVSASDAASGLLEIHYQVDEGPIQSANAASPAAAGALPPQTFNTAARFVVTAEGRHSVRVWAVDRAGNVEPSHVYEVKIDRTAPTARLTGPTAAVTRTDFDVTWVGGDAQDGSGLASYDVQVRDGYTGAWQDWLVRTKLVSASFKGERGHQYTFRVYGRDQAGNRQDPPASLRVLVQPVLNGNFDTGNFEDWTTGGLLFSSVVGTTGPGNASTLAAKLGSDIYYDPSLEPPGNVPPGCAVMSQPITVPTLEQVQRPRLRFWHRVLSYDVMWSERLQDYVDTLDVKLTDSHGNLVAMLLRTGNPTDKYRELYDSGWQFADLDLRSFAGWSGVLTFANCNGPQKAPDNLLNTWSYVDSIQITDSSAMYLPLVGQPNPTGPSAVAASQEPLIAPQPEETDSLR